MDHKTDKIFREIISDKTQLPDSLNWSKEAAWEKLKKKKHLSRTLKLSASLAAVILIVFTLTYFVSGFDKNNLKTEYKIEDEFEEYRKRQKLTEIEMKMSGKDVYKNYCINCEGTLPDMKKNKINYNIYLQYN